MKRLFVAVGLALLAVPAVASDGPSFDCTKASSSAEEMICATPELAVLDARLAGRFQSALDAIRGLDSGAEEAEAELRATQRGWIKGRDECWKAADEEDCVRFAYQSRENELVAFWMLEEPTETTFWACDGNPANEVVTMFFDTELPSVRFERGDSVDAGSLTRTASGSRYDGSFGRFIWIKGDEATYREPDPDGSEYACKVAN